MTRLALRLVLAADADDVVQESLTRAWLRWNTYDPSRGGPRTWLLGIIADQARRHRTRNDSGNLVLIDGVEGHDQDVAAVIDVDRAVRALSGRSLSR